MRKHTVDLGSNRDSFGVADEVAQLIDAYLLYRRAVVSANTAATDERLLRYLRDYLTTPDAQRHTQLRPLFLGFLGWLRTLRDSRRFLSHPRKPRNSGRSWVCRWASGVVRYSRR